MVQEMSQGPPHRGPRVLVREKGHYCASETSVLTQPKLVNLNSDEGRCVPLGASSGRKTPGFLHIFAHAYSYTPNITTVHVWQLVRLVQYHKPLIIFYKIVVIYPVHIKTRPLRYALSRINGDLHVDT